MAVFGSWRGRNNLHLRVRPGQKKCSWRLQNRMIYLYGVTLFILQMGRLVKIDAALSLENAFQYLLGSDEGALLTDAICTKPLRSYSATICFICLCSSKVVCTTCTVWPTLSHRHRPRLHTGNIPHGGFKTKRAERMPSFSTRPFQRESCNRPRGQSLNPRADSPLLPFRGRSEIGG